MLVTRQYPVIAVTHHFALAAKPSKSDGFFVSQGPIDACLKNAYSCNNTSSVSRAPATAAKLLFAYSAARLQIRTLTANHVSTQAKL